VSRAFEELARQPTPIGEISLRRRLEPTLQVDVFEVKLGDDFLMSSLFTTGERELARLGLAATPVEELDVVVGGLGLGYTAREALEDPRVRSLRVIDALAPVIDWHRRGLVPLGGELTADQRCEFVHGDFFTMVAEGLQFSPDGPTRFDVILLDIDHSPRHLLHPRHAGFYEPAGLRRLAEQLHPGGVFALWSNDPPDDRFVTALGAEFAAAEALVVTFPNFYTGTDAQSTIYVATTAGGR
jgi:spermidine synthase